MKYRNIKFQTYKNIILLVVLHEYETYFSTLKENTIRYLRTGFWGEHLGINGMKSQETREIKNNEIVL
jgi:hypothetical protein